MQQNLKNNGRQVNRIVSRLAAEKKKTVIALCLIGMMIFMWVRVLGRKGPKEADAALLAEQVDAVQQIKQLKISFIELPHIKGRNDVLTRDFFTVGSWYEFVRIEDKNQTGNEEVNIISKDGLEVAKLIAEKLKLEVIELGRIPHAFINEKILTVGDKLQVDGAGAKYECEVIRIEKNTVYVRCGEAEIQLKLTQTTEEGGQ